MKIKVHRFNDATTGMDMIVIRDKNDMVFTISHIDLFWEDRNKDGWHQRLASGEQLVFELVETTEQGE